MHLRKALTKLLNVTLWVCFDSQGRGRLHEPGWGRQPGWVSSGEVVSPGEVASPGWVDSPGQPFSSETPATVYMNPLCDPGQPSSRLTRFDTWVACLGGLEFEKHFPCKHGFMWRGCEFEPGCWNRQNRFIRCWWCAIKKQSESIWVIDSNDWPACW